jgi:hypothetical protein
MMAAIRNAQRWREWVNGMVKEVMSESGLNGRSSPPERDRLAVHPCATAA